MDMLTSPAVCRWLGCNLYFTDSQELLVHCTNDHIGRKSTNNLCLDCHWEGCDVKTTKRDHITSHMKVHISHKPHACLRCGKTFKRPQDLKKHEKLHIEGQEGQNQNNIIFQPYIIPSPEYSSNNGLDVKVPKRDLSPQSASSEILATTPRRKSSQDPPMNQYFNQLYNGIIEKQLAPQYNNEMSSFLNTLATSEDYAQSLQSVVNKDMDINYFNSFMGQLQNDITGNLGGFQNIPNSYVSFQQGMSSMPPCNQGFDPAFPINGNTYMFHNDQAYFNNHMNPCQQNYQQQEMNLYQSMNFNNGMNSQTNIPYDMNLVNQYVPMEAPQINYNSCIQYNSMTVTPQRCESSEFLGEDEDSTSIDKAIKDDPLPKKPKETVTKVADISTVNDSVSSEVESLAQTLKNLELYSKEGQGKAITPKEADERLQHAALINDLVAKVNSIYKALNTPPKPSPKKEKFISGLIEKKAQTSVTLSSGSYPSLDDL